MLNNRFFVRKLALPKYDIFNGFKWMNNVLPTGKIATATYPCCRYKYREFGNMSQKTSAKSLISFSRDEVVYTFKGIYFLAKKKRNMAPQALSNFL